MAILVFKNGAGEPDVMAPISFLRGSVLGTRLGQSALDHFKADKLRAAPPPDWTACKASRPIKVPLSSLSQRFRPASKHVNPFRNLVPVKAHARLEPQRVARAQAARPYAKLGARIEQRLPHLYRGRLIARDVDFESVFAAVTGPRDQHIRHAGNCSPGEPVVLDRREIHFGQLGQRFKRARPLQRELRVIAGVVADVDPGNAATCCESTRSPCLWFRR